MILSSIQAACYRRLSLGTSPASDVVTRILDYINETHKEILSDPIMTKLRRRTLTFSTVANQRSAALPRAVSIIRSVVDPNNRRSLDDYITTAAFRQADPGGNFSSATPQGYAITDYASPVAKQPSDSSQLYVKSSAAGDTGTAYIEVIDSDGELKTASVVMTGVTAAAIGPVDAVQVVDFYVGTAAVGEIVLLEDSSVGTELAKIGIGMTRGRYTLVEIYPIPSDVVSLQADVDIVVSDLANATDEPLIPDEFTEAIIKGVLAREYDKRKEYKVALKHERDQQVVLGRLRHRMHQTGQQTAPPQGQIRQSQLGPYYPPNS